MVDLDEKTLKPLKKPPISDDEDDVEDKTMTEYGNAALWVPLFTGLCLIIMCIAAFFIIRKMRKNEKKEIDRASTGTGTETKSTDQKKEFDTVQRRMSLKTMASKNVPLESIIIQQHKSHVSRVSTSKKSERTSTRSRHSLSKKSQKSRNAEGGKETSSKSQKEKNTDFAEETPSSSSAAAKKTSRYEKVCRRSKASTGASMQTTARSPLKSTIQQGSTRRGTKSSKLK